MEVAEDENKIPAATPHSGYVSVYLVALRFLLLWRSGEYISREASGKDVFF